MVSTSAFGFLQQQKISQSERIGQVSISLFKNCNVDPFAHPERDRKCWGWGECHPAVVNRQNFDCSVCPTADPTTWTADDLNFKVTCEEEKGTMSFQLDNLLEVKWLQWASLELAYSTSSQGDFREPITSAAGIQKRTISNLTHICLNFKEGINMKQAICGSCGTETTTAS